MPCASPNGRAPSTGITLSLLGLAFCASFNGDDHRAAVLHGAADASLETVGEAHEQVGTEFRAHDHRRLRDAMGDAEFEVAYTSGRTLSQRDAVALGFET